ncbi:MAG: 50S ribosomal protein L4 [Bdellovibrionaceae bacterium]|nr:50S ribosomal protein L4 [Pseudobdellovibrionaceae bacterium]
MAKLKVLKWDKTEAGSVSLSEDIFTSPIREDLMHQVVRWQLACRRQGTHQAKTRSEVRGGGAKPFKQKGTGRARQGSSRSPILRGGAVVHGPRPRDYSYALPKKVKQLALKSALSYLFASKKVIVIDSLSSDGGKTKELAKRFADFGLKKAVLVDSKETPLFKQAVNNLYHFCYYSTQGVNVYDLLKYDTLVLTKNAVEGIYTRCGVAQ